MNDNRNLEMLDMLNIMSFVIGMLNYQETLTQSDKQDLLSEVDSKAKKIVKELKYQTILIEKIYTRIKEMMQYEED